MAYPHRITSEYKFVTATPLSVQTTNGGITFQAISLRHAHKVWLHVKLHQDVGHATTVQIDAGATAVGATNAITFAAPWEMNADVSVNDTLVQQVAATAQAVAADALDKHLVVEIDPSAVLAQNATYDWLGGGIATSGQATNFCSADWIIAYRYKEATPPTAL